VELAKPGRDFFIGAEARKRASEAGESTELDSWSLSIFPNPIRELRKDAHPKDMGATWLSTGHVPFIRMKAGDKSFYSAISFLARNTVHEYYLLLAVLFQVGELFAWG
jgi:hypothetical protein